MRTQRVCLETNTCLDHPVPQGEQAPSLLRPGGKTKLTCSVCCVDALKHWKEKEGSAYHLNSSLKG